MVTVLPMNAFGFVLGFILSVWGPRGASSDPLTTLKRQRDEHCLPVPAGGRQPLTCSESAASCSRQGDSDDELAIASAAAAASR